MVGIVVPAFALCPTIRFASVLALTATVMRFAIKAHQFGLFAYFHNIEFALVELAAAELLRAIRALICNVSARAVSLLFATWAHEVNVFASMLLNFAVVPKAYFEYVFANGAPASVGR